MVLFWLVEYTTIFCLIQLSDDCSLPYLTAADASRHHYTCAIAYFQRFVRYPSGFRSIAIFGLWGNHGGHSGFFERKSKCDVLIGSSCSRDCQPGVLCKVLQRHKSHDDFTNDGCMFAALSITDRQYSLDKHLYKAVGLYSWYTVAEVNEEKFICLVKRSYLVSSLSHKGLHQGWTQTSLYPQVIHPTSHHTTSHVFEPICILRALYMGTCIQQGDLFYFADLHRNQC